jgi:tRNA A-37 threonylcarbamoyl transferase component Bud32/WD40 repeat protein
MAEHIAQVQRAFSAYAIEKAVGSGGMATVYRAHDKKHKRKVAIKVLHAEVAALVGSKRFLQEIRITAKLQHPHILGLIDSGILGEGAGELAGRPYYVMPYIDGESLRQRLEREKLLPIADTVRLVTEIASALDYAHRQGIIHRDVKPENILLHDGSAIVADFGIALAVTHAGVSRLTETGTTLGTPFYMSPEQAMGERGLTGRSDIYSLGALCYELLAGEPPFTGKTQQAIVARIITDEPRALSTVRRSVPPHVAAAVSQALEKIPADRFATAHDFATALSSPAVTPSTSIPALEESKVAAGARPVARAAPSNRPLYAVGALAVLMAAVALWGWLRPRPASPVLGYRLVFDSTEAMVAGGSYITRLALSPDGSRLAYIGGPKAQLFIRPRNQLRGTAVPGTEALNTPFFSPDGQYVGVMADNNLQVFSLTGGPRMHITDTLVGVAGASWGRDGFIYADGAGFERLLRIEAKPNAVPKWFTTLDTASGEFDHLWPDALPNGKGVLFTVASRVKNSTLNTWAFSIAVAGIPAGKHRVLVNNAKFARYSPSGHLLYVTSDRKLMVAPFDQGLMKVTGEPALLSENMRLGTLGSADLTISATGTLLYGTGGGQPANQLVWVTRDGKAQPVDSAWTGLFRSPAISPDGSRLAVERGSEIWTKQLDGGPSLRLAFEGTENTFPWWTPDGRSITYTSTAASSYDIWTKKADGSAPAVRQLHMARGVFGPVWSPDGTWLIVRTDESATGALGSPSGIMPDILGMRPGIDSAPQPLVATKFTEESPAFSPDGRWLAYSSDESGEKEVYVVPFPNTSAAKWPISSRGGREPVWSHSGRELFYRDDAGNMIAVAVQTNPTFSPGRSTVLFQARGYVARAFPAQYAVSRDDRRFLMIRPLPIAPDELVVVENWFQELQSRLGK